MEPNCTRGVLNCVGVPGGTYCCRCGELVKMAFVCTGCERMVCVACIDGHCDRDAPAEESGHVATD
jgi:hypothetical protein